MRSILFRLLLLLFQTTVSAQTLSIVDNETGFPIADVFVFSDDNLFANSTDKKGQIVLENATDEQVFFFQHPAYEMDSFSFKRLKEQDLFVGLIPNNILLPETTVKAFRLQESVREVSNTVEKITAKTIARQQAGTTADVLGQTGSVFIQKSQLGGGSPIIRGLEANKVLLVIDGVRMNNAIYRGGHLQNSLTIDPAVLDNALVVFGPGSLVYGSDALGGAMIFSSKNPRLSNKDKTVFSGTLSSRYATVNQAKTQHLDFNIGLKKWGFLSSITYNDFGDLTIGKNRTHGNPTWGQQLFYAQRINGEDQQIANENPNRLVNSGYRQFDLLQKIRFQPKEGHNLILNVQYSNSSDISRYDRLNDFTSDSTLKFSEWYYGPQKRLLTALNYEVKTASALADEWTATLAYQEIEESRINRDFNNANQKNRIEQLMIGSFNIDALKKIKEQHKLQYGLEWTYNDVQSTAFVRNINTEEISSDISTRYPDGKNFTQSTAVYTRYKWQISPKLLVNGGLRATLNQLQISYDNLPPLSIDFTESKDQHFALTYALGGIYYPNQQNRLAMNVSSGFRSPNIDDIGKIFDPTPNTVVIPNADVQPEYSHTFDINWQQKAKFVTYQVDAYVNYLTNLIRRTPATLAGADSLIYDGVPSKIFYNSNTAEALIYGFSLSGKIKLSKDFTFQQKVLFTKGIDLSIDEPLGHIPPIFGQSELRFTKQNFGFTVWSDFHLAKKLQDYSLNGEDKLEEALPDGTPAWYTINVRGHYDLGDHFTTNISLENLLDQHYIPFASGISGPGRNVVLSIVFRI